MKGRIPRGMVVVLLAAITLFFPLLVSPHRIDEKHRDLIREGMTEAEVADIFGAPAGVYDWAVLDESQALKIATYRALVYLARLQDAQSTEQKETRFYAPVSALTLKLRRLSLGGMTTKTWTSRHGSVTISFDDDGQVAWVGDWHKTHVVPPWERWWKKVTGK